MGELQLFDVSAFKEQYKLDVFVETGTGDATSLRYIISKTNFLKYYSIEIYKPLCDIAKKEFIHNTNVEIINDSSYNGLKQIFTKINLDNRIFFWLDAHFPDADFGGPNQYSSIKDKTLRIPLEEELKLIKESRPNCKDFFIIDDLRIYEDNNYEKGNWKDRELYGGNNIDFVYKYFSDTHIITKLMNHQGYLILVPKEQKL